MKETVSKQLKKTLVRESLISWKEIKSILMIVLGIASATFALEFFIVPNHLLDGGVTGISLLVSFLTDYDVSIMILLINLPFIFMGYRQVNSKFAIKTLLAIIGLSGCIMMMHSIHPAPITEDKLLISVFGGFFLGTGIGLSMRGGAVIDGTEVLALYLSKKTSVQVGDTILAINIIIFVAAAIIIDIQTAMYSILTYLSASKTVDFITNGIEEYTGVTIISNEHKKIRKMIIAKLGRGVTIYKGSRGLRGKLAKEDGLDERDILYTIVTKLELPKLKNEIEKIDPNCFIAQHHVNSVKGGMIKKRSLH